jgi:medium-chain acyl-[acyl-carrier-protein] hydrolase
LLERPFTRLRSLVDAFVEAVGRDLKAPFCFFGHSMGALVCYELARRLQREGQPGLALLCVSGHRAPHLRSRDPPIHDLPDDEFVVELRRLNGTPEVLWDGDLRGLMLPALRADFAVAETYVYESGEPLDCPIVAYGGTEDELVSQEEIAAWREHTGGTFRRRMIPGDHFFLKSARDVVLTALSDDLGSIH